jgi:hypothetical protein
MVKYTKRILNNIYNAPSILKKRLYIFIKQSRQIERNLENSIRQTNNTKVIKVAIERYQERQNKMINDLVKSTFPFANSSKPKV